ncbi:MAG: precorrin-2 C(20)-methyltransferase [Candidatus Methanomethylophilaceae archaeon]|nr:precorrin-2 C(20)-methyltransferase [Candidatus Methanomethylophilaceae archaeon]
MYGISVGPGEPGLLTLKAKQILDSCDIIAYPVKTAGEGSVALNIIKPNVDLSKKQVKEYVFSMNPDYAEREKGWKIAYEDIAESLKEGKDIAMITLGDLSIFSTYMRIDKVIKSMGFETETIPGVPSFCHGASLAKKPLTMGEESLVIIPFNQDQSEKLLNALENFENIVVMKAYKSVDKIADMVISKGRSLSCITVMSNIGMKDEYIGPVVPGREYGYFTTLLIKQEEKE